MCSTDGRGTPSSPQSRVWLPDHLRECRINDTYFIAKSIRKHQIKVLFFTAGAQQSRLGIPTNGVPSRAACSTGGQRGGTEDSRPSVEAGEAPPGSRAPAREARGAGL